MTLAYKSRSPRLPVSRRRKRSSAGSRPMPAFLVQLKPCDCTCPGKYARVHIREKTGGYRYAVWRDGERVRSAYLGRLRESCPTSELRSGSGRRRPGPRGPQLARRPKKQVSVQRSCVGEVSRNRADGTPHGARRKRREPRQRGSRRAFSRAGVAG